MSHASRTWGYRPPHHSDDDSSRSSDDEVDHKPNCVRPTMEVVTQRTTVLTPLTLLRNIVYSLVVSIENGGSIDQSSVSVALSLQNVFIRNGAPLDLIATPPSSIRVVSTFATPVNAAYNGTTVTQLLAPGAILVPGRSQIEVTVTFGSTLTQSMDDVRLGSTGVFSMQSKCGRTTYTRTAPIAADAPAASLAVTKRYCGDLSAPLAVGEVGSFVVTVANSGDVALRQVVLTDVFNPAHWEFASAVPAPTSVSGGTATWNNLSGSMLPDGALDAGEVLVLCINLRALAVAASTANAASATGLANLVSVSSGAPSSISVSIVAAPEIPRLSLVKALCTEPVTAYGAAQVVFALTVANTSTLPLYTVTLTDLYPAAYLDYQSASTSPTSSVPGMLTWVIPTLAADSVQTILVRFTSKLPVSESALVNQANVTALTAPSGGSTLTVGPRTASVTVLDLPPVLRVFHARCGENTAPSVQVGDQVDYVVTVHNDGPRTAEHVVLEYTYDPVQFAVLHTNPAYTSSPSSGRLQWTDFGGVGGLDVNASAAACVALRALAPAAAAVTDADASAESGAIQANHDSASVSILQRPAFLSLVHTLCTEPDTCVEAFVTDTFQVSNTGGTAVSSAVTATYAYDAAILELISAVPAATASVSGVTVVSGVQPWADAWLVHQSSPATVLTFSFAGPVAAGTTLPVRLSFRALAPSADTSPVAYAASTAPPLETNAESVTLAVVQPSALAVVPGGTCALPGNFGAGESCPFDMADLLTTRIRFVGAYETAAGGGIENTIVEPLRLGSNPNVLVTVSPSAPTGSFASIVTATAVLNGDVFVLSPGAYLPDGTLQWQMAYLLGLQMLSSDGNRPLTSMRLRFEMQTYQSLQQTQCASLATAPRRVFDVTIQSVPPCTPVAAPDILDWVGYINVHNLPFPDGDGGFAGFGFVIGSIPWTATVSPGPVVTLAANTSIDFFTSVDPGGFWWSNNFDNQGYGLRETRSNFYGELPLAPGRTVTFSGKCVSYFNAAPITAASTTPSHVYPAGYAYTAKAFIRDFNDFYSLLNATDVLLVPGQTFQLTLPVVNGAHVQMGFETSGPNMRAADAASVGTAVITDIETYIC